MIHCAYEYTNNTIEFPEIILYVISQYIHRRTLIYAIIVRAALHFNSELFPGNVNWRKKCNFRARH